MTSWALWLKSASHKEATCSPSARPVKRAHSSWGCMWPVSLVVWDLVLCSPLWSLPSETRAVVSALGLLPKNGLIPRVCGQHSSRPSPLPVRVSPTFAAPPGLRKDDCVGPSVTSAAAWWFTYPIAPAAPTFWLCFCATLPRVRTVESVVEGVPEIIWSNSLVSLKSKLRLREEQ